ncbi:MAG: 1-acyl-sn-glycerol-3-phosphate acyltransferase, partial [Bacteroidaceae bacterium]|nr:1-acyl-sn-glycerol-3-phosphate acyltransferase [Bacteroidaceae bacterium]
FGKACESAKHIFVDKSGPKAIQQTYDQARQILRNGTSLVVFPEGSLSFTGHMAHFRRGAFQLANELGLSVVPVTIDGSFDVLPRQKGFGFLTWHALRLIIHDPIAPAEKGLENVRLTMEKSYSVIMNSLPARHQGFVENPDQ